MTYLAAKAHISSFPPPPSGVPLHKVWLLLSLCPESTLSHLDHVQFQIFILIP